jgi:hypothetical protein
MKWKHKVTGWTAQTAYYEMPKSSITCTMIKDDKQVNFHIPHELIDADDNWIPQPDERWLYKQMTAMEFMDAFAMTTDPSGQSHDAFVVKSLIDKNYNITNE